MIDLKTKRELAAAIRKIRPILDYRGYPLNGMKNVDAISIFAKIEFSEEITPTKKVCNEWLLSKLPKLDLIHMPKRVSKGSGQQFNLAMRQVRYWLKCNCITTTKFDQKELIRAFAQYKFREDAYDFKAWLINKMEIGVLVGMPIGTRTKKKIKKQSPLGSSTGNKSTPASEYRLFLKTDYWKEVRQKVISRDKRACTKCGRSDKLHVHHTTYANHLKEHRHLGDLITLCEDCHKKEHQK